MIKEIYRDVGGSLWEITCDSCHVKIGNCEDFQFEEGQELIYAPLLCETCGRKSNYEAGENVKKIERLENEVKRWKGYSEALTSDDYGGG